MAQGYICAIGGGSENYNDWSDEPYKWIIQKSDSGKIIILGVNSSDNWLPNYFISLGANTSYNLTISSKTFANLQTTFDEIISAKAIFIRGGDQWDYIRLWKGTKTDSAINNVFKIGGVIAGTSAGAAILGEIDFSAKNGTVYADEALQNPFNNYIQFENNFLNFVPNIIFDTHFIERGRHARLISMLYNLHLSSDLNLIGIGIDDRTAIGVSPNGIGEVMGSGAVSIFYKDEITKYSSFITGKYSIENLKLHLLIKGWQYDFINNEIFLIPQSAKDFDTSKIWQFPKTDFYLTGSNDINSQLENNLSNFLSSTNSSNVCVITHQGFSQISTLTNYLNSNSFNLSVINITSANLNNIIEAEKINSSTCFIFVGDSLDVLSNLNQGSQLVPKAFQNSINLNKPIFFLGNAGKLSNEKFIENTDSDIYASYRGKMTINSGLNIFGELIFQPLVFSDRDFLENRTSAVLWGLMRNRKRIGVYLNGEDRLEVTSMNKSIKGIAETPYIIVDARNTTKVDSSTYRAKNSVSTRQVVAMNDLRFSLTNYSDVIYLLEEGKFDNLTEVKDDISKTFPDRFILYQNYPNPFNPTTIIEYTIPNFAYIQMKDSQILNMNQQNVSLKIYDALGKEVATLVNEVQKPGNYRVTFDASSISSQKTVKEKISSGIYFYRLTLEGYSETKPMVYLK